MDDQKRADGLLALAIRQAEALGIPAAKGILPQVKLNRRATGRFGCCIRRGNVYTIELAARMLAAEDRMILQTLVHEVLHTCPGCANHGPRWKSWAERMNRAYGYHISRTDSPDRLGLPDEGPARYLLVCTRCGAEIGRSRRSAVVQHPERYRCRCGGRLERKR